jgi:hypothetical protein
MSAMTLAEAIAALDQWSPQALAEFDEVRVLLDHARATLTAATGGEHPVRWEIRDSAELTYDISGTAEGADVFRRIADEHCAHAAPHRVVPLYEAPPVRAALGGVGQEALRRARVLAEDAVIGAWKGALSDMSVGEIAALVAYIDTLRAALVTSTMELRA